MTSGPSLQFLLDYLSGALNLVDLSGADNRVQDQGQHGDRIRNRLNQVGGERTQGGQSRTNTVAETEQHGSEERTDGVCVGEVHGSQRDEAAAGGHVPAEEVHVTHGEVHTAESSNEAGQQHCHGLNVEHLDTDGLGLSLIHIC